MAFGQGGVPGGPSSVIRDFKTPPLQGSDTFIIPFMLPLRIEPKSDIEIRAKGILAGAFVTGGFEGWYE